MSLRVALVGAGQMGKNHARVIDSLPGLELVAIVDRIGDRYGVGRGRKLLKELDQLDCEELDLAVIATPPSEHESNTKFFLTRQVNVFVEKPLSDSLDGALRMDELLRKSGLFGAVGHIERFNPALQELYKRMRNRELGKVFQIATRRAGSFPERIRDVGVVKDLATHDFDFTAWLGESEYESISARTGEVVGNGHEDFLVAIGQLRNGIAVSHLVNWVSPFKERKIIVSGERGAFVADTLMGDLEFISSERPPIQWENFSNLRGISEGQKVSYSFPRKEPLMLELENVRDCLMNKPGFSVSFAEGAGSLRVAEAALKSARSGAGVML